MKNIKIKCPAKINLDLRVFKKDEQTGYHPIKSIMQTINLFDYLDITIDDNNAIRVLPIEKFTASQKLKGESNKFVSSN